MPDRFLAVHDAAVAYGYGAAKAFALRGISIAFGKGTLTVVMGPSGSGKTTLLSLLGCLLTPDTGKVYVGGVDTSGVTEKKRSEIRRTNIGFIFQAFRLFRSLSALDNIRIGAELAGRDADGEAHAILARLGLEHRAHLKPDALSGGEKQRVAIARALIKNPGIVLADEPTASLDSDAGREIRAIMRSLTREDGRTVVVVSHDPRWTEFADRVVTLRDGTVAEDRGMTA